VKRRDFIRTAGIAGITTKIAFGTSFFTQGKSKPEMPESDNGLSFFDTCVRIGRSRAPDPPDNWKSVEDLDRIMERHNVSAASVEHAVAMEASPGLGHSMLATDIANHDNLWPAWHLMPDISPRIEKAVTDPQEIIRNRVSLGRVDAKDFCHGIGGI